MGGSLFPTSLCGALVFRSSSALLLVLLLLARLLLDHSHTHHSHTNHLYTYHTHTHTHTQITYTQITHPQITHIQITHTQITRTQIRTLELGDMDLDFAWHAWHLVTWTVILRGRRGTYGTVLVLVTRWVAAGLRLVAAHFAWQAWHLVTWTFTLRGRHGTWWHGPSFCVASVALMVLGWYWRGAGLPLGCGWSPHTLRGRRGTWWHGPSLCVAGAALGDMDLHFAWQAWHLWYLVGTGDALGCLGEVDMWDYPVL